MGLILADSEHSYVNYLQFAGVNDTSDALQPLHYLFSDTNGEVRGRQTSFYIIFFYYSDFVLNLTRKKYSFSTVILNLWPTCQNIA